MLPDGQAIREAKERAPDGRAFPDLVYLAGMLTERLAVYVSEQCSSRAGGLGPEEGVRMRQARPGSLGPAAAHCGLDRLVAREDSRTLRCTGLQLARE